MGNNYRQWKKEYEVKTISVIFGCFSFLEKSTEVAAAEAEGGSGEGAAAGKGARERTAAYSQTC